MLFPRLRSWSTINPSVWSPFPISRDRPVHITTICPSCQTRWNVEPSLRGQRMRCPNASCREVFEVREAVESAPEKKAPEPPSASAPMSGSVGDVVPILKAEEVPAPAAPRSARRNARLGESVPILNAEVVEQVPQDAPTWRQPPPVRKPPSPEAPKSSPGPAPAADAPDWQAAPPPRRQPVAPTEAPPDWRDVLPRKPDAKSEPAATEGPVEMPVGAWDAPPV